MKKLLLFLILLSAYTSFACTCIPFDRKPLFKKFNEVTEIFQGRLIKKELPDSLDLIKYYLRVEKAYKGVIKDEIFIITTPSNSAACGQFIDDTSSWLIYANNGFTTECSNNRNLSRITKQTPTEFNYKLNKIIHKNLVENLTMLKESNTIVEINQKGDTIATGKLNINKQPIGYWKYTHQKNECTVTRNVCYDDYGCILEDHSVKSCN